MPTKLEQVLAIDAYSMHVRAQVSMYVCTRVRAQHTHTHTHVSRYTHTHEYANTHECINVHVSNPLHRAPSHNQATIL